MRRAALLAMLLGIACAASARNEPNGCRAFPTPDGAKLLYVASDMVLNGVPMSIKEMRTKDAPEAVLAFYRREWGSRKPGSFETPTQDWRTIATFEGRCYYTVQVRAAGSGTYALLGVSRKPDVRPQAPGAGFPMPMGSRVFNDLASHDGPKSGRTVMLGNAQAPQQNVQFYRETFERQGWVSLVDKQVETEKGPAHMMLWKRGLEEASLTVQRVGNRTMVVANLVDQP
ncbi:MAG TPA: hypothetical protein VFB08_16590 [Burkholderiales bacterium]|nr:hypothetical protein [Burkholderiales bacterium]